LPIRSPVESNTSASRRTCGFTELVIAETIVPGQRPGKDRKISYGHVNPASLHRG
jgi:hypothetical protein